MPEPTEVARKVFDGLSDVWKANIRSFGFALPVENPDLSMFTCADCPSVDDCEWAFDAYNTGGDCLAVK